MILRLSFEEIAALSAGAHRLVQRPEGPGHAAPVSLLAEVETLIERLDGDLEVTTFEEAEHLERGVGIVLDDLRRRMDALILEEYVGAEDATLAYFDYAHVLGVWDRVRSIRDEMAALIELMTGRPPTPETARQVNFPD